MSFPSQWHWPAVMLALALSVLLVGMGAFLLAVGASDSHRAQALLWEDTLLVWANGTNPQSSSQWYTSPQPLPPDEFTLEVVGILLADAPTLSAWGIWLQFAPDEWLLVGINGHQFVTARYCHEPPQDYLLMNCVPAIEPTQRIETVWKSFHLIQSINHANHIQLSKRASQPTLLTLRFGGEWMWDLVLNDSSAPIQWGIWALPDTTTLTFVQWTAVRFWGNIE